MLKRASTIGLSVLATGLIGGSVVAMNLPKTVAKPTKPVTVKLTSTTTKTTAPTTSTAPTASTTTSTSTVQTSTPTTAPAPTPATPVVSPSAPTTSSTTATVVSFKEVPVANTQNKDGTQILNTDCQITYSNGTTFSWLWQTYNPEGSWTENSFGQDGHYTSGTATLGKCDSSLIGLTASEISY